MNTNTSRGSSRGSIAIMGTGLAGMGHAGGATEQEIIAQAVQRLRNKAAYSSLPCALLPELFTLRELQEVYEQVLGQALDKSSFRRKIDELGFVAPSEAFTVGTHRPARLYSFRGYTAFDRSLTTRK